LDTIHKTNEIFNTPYEQFADSWFETEGGLSLPNYIKKLLTIVKGNLACNVEENTTKAILVPHAGIRYSGLCSASAYYELTNRTRPIKNIILLCTSHIDISSSSDRIVSVDNGESLNIIAPRFSKISTMKKTKHLAVDIQFIKKLKNIVQMDSQDNAYFQQEHAFFNQIPFLETIAPDASICPLLIGNIITGSNGNGSVDPIKLKQTSIKLQILIKLLRDKLAKNDTVLICSSDFSHINGHFDKQVSSNIFQNIRRLDNETLQFLYNIVDGNESRNRIIDTVLFMQNSTTCGIMAIYLFGKVMNNMQNLYKSSGSSSSTDSESHMSSITNGRGMGELDSSNDNYVCRYYSRVSCYYSSITRDFINIIDSNGCPFDKKGIVPIYEIRGVNKSSVSYVGLIYTRQPYVQKTKSRRIENMFSQYEELALLGLAREQLFYHLMKTENKQSVPTNLIKPINAQAFNLELGVFTTLRTKTKNGNEFRRIGNSKSVGTGTGTCNGLELRGCIGTLETDNDEFNIESNIKKYVIKAAMHDSRFTPVELKEFQKLEISITVLYNIAPISLNQYFTNKFQLGRDGILMKLGKTQGYFLPSVAIDLGLRTSDKNKLLDELCREKVAGCDTKTAFRKYSNMQLFYNEGVEISFT
jgi:uncharacterized protein (TIGR00296 family)/AmmeMemoRadiSam system protein B